MGEGHGPWAMGHGPWAMGRAPSSKLPDPWAIEDLRGAFGGTTWLR
jgi:hypothetical protein